MGGSLEHVGVRSLSPTSRQTKLSLDSFSGLMSSISSDEGRQCDGDEGALLTAWLVDVLARAIVHRRVAVVPVIIESVWRQLRFRDSMWALA